MSNGQVQRASRKVEGYISKNNGSGKKNKRRNRKRKTNTDPREIYELARKTVLRIERFWQDAKEKLLAGKWTKQEEKRLRRYASLLNKYIKILEGG